MPYTKTYSEAELFVFRQKDKRIIFQSIFSSLCSTCQSHIEDDMIVYYKDIAKEMTDCLCEQYPTEEREKTPEYKAEELNKKIEETEKLLATFNKLKEGSPGF